MEVMDKELVERALSEKLTANEWKVLAALSLGHREVYDIQQVTGLQRIRINAVVQNAQSTNNSLLSLLSSRSTSSSNDTDTPYLHVSTAQFVQSPPQQLLSYFDNKLRITSSNLARDLKIMKEIYLFSYKNSSQQSLLARRLVKYLVDIYAEKLLTVGAPLPYFFAIVKGYFPIPKAPYEIRQTTLALNVEFFYNPLNQQWERQYEDLRGAEN